MEVSDVGSRFDSVFTNWLRCGENTAVINTKGMTLDEIAIATLEMWIDSPPHHKTLLKPTRYYAGDVSSQHSTKWVRSKYTSSNSWVYVTLNLYGGSIVK